MLAADKLLLECRIARGAVQLKWKEFGLHHLNLTTVGTQAAVMAGFSITALIEFAPSPDANRALLFLFWTSNMVSLACNILCVATTTMLSVYGSSLSTRGADGSWALQMTGEIKGMADMLKRAFEEETARRAAENEAAEDEPADEPEKKNNTKNRRK